MGISKLMPPLEVLVFDPYRGVQYKYDYFYNLDSCRVGGVLIGPQDPGVKGLNWRTGVPE